VGTCDDLDKGLRSREELDYWLCRCPIKMLEKTIKEKGILSDSEKESLFESISEEIKEAEEFAKESVYPEKESLFKDVFK